MLAPLLSLRRVSIWSFLVVSQLAFAQTVVNFPTISPAAVTVERKTTVTVTAFVQSASEKPNEVLLVRIGNHRDEDRVLTGLSDKGDNDEDRALARLNDDGRDGDVVAHDGIYTARFSIEPESVEPIRFQAVAVFRKRHHHTRLFRSPTFELDVSPVGIPVALKPPDLSKIIRDSGGNLVACNILFVSLNPGTTFFQLEDLIRSVSGQIVGRSPELNVYQIELPSCDAASLQNSSAIMASSVIIQFVTTDSASVVTGPLIPNDPLLIDQWYLDVIHAFPAWAIVTHGSSIAIVDTGINYNHEDLTGNVTLGLDICSTLVNGVCQAGLDPKDGDGHGTAMAGLAAAKTNNSKGIAGMAFSAPLIAEKVFFDSNGKAKSLDSAIAEGIVDAVRLGARVINLSLVGGNLLNHAAEYALRHGRVVVASAGNGGTTDMLFPAAAPGVIAVGGSDKDNKPEIFASDCPPGTPLNGIGSEIGDWVDIYAPSADLTLLESFSNSGYIRECTGGTSGAAAIVSGAASLVLGANPNLTPPEVKAILKNTATRTNGIRILNLFEAVLAARRGNNPVPSVSSVVPGTALFNSGATLTVFGTDFVLGAQIQIDGVPMSETAFISAQELSAGIPASAIPQPGAHQITVLNPIPRGGVSPNPVPLIVVPNQSPSAGFTMVSGNQSATEGQVLTLPIASGSTASIALSADRSKAANGSIDAWQWSIDGTVAFSASNFTTSLAIGNHPIQLIVTDNLGLKSAPASATVVVQNLGPHFIQTGTMNNGRVGHTATLLTDGTVLLVGGVDESGILNTAEIYDPHTGIFTPTGSLNFARENHTATLLADGRVLIVGGRTAGSGPAQSQILTSAEIYAPLTHQFVLTGSMTTPRQIHTATLLMTGEILVMGGSNFGDPEILSSAEIFDPSLGTFRLTGPMNVPRQVPLQATLLPNGKVLIAGGFALGFNPALSSAEVYDRSTETFTLTPPMAVPHGYDAATLLNNGQVLISGGVSPQLAISEVFDPVQGNFRFAGLLTTGRQHNTATLLQDGNVLVAGGTSLLNAELYTTQSGSFSATAAMNISRFDHTATLLPHGNVLLSGGVADLFTVTGLHTAELFEPQTLPSSALPRLMSLSPVSVRPNTPVNLIVAGLGFRYGATININGAALETKFISSSLLCATVPASALATVSGYSVTVTNPAPSGTSSDILTFTVAQ